MAANVSLPPLLSAKTTLTKTNKSQSKQNPSSQNPSLKICKTIAELQKLHCQITKQGLLQNPSSITNLITSSLRMGTTESLNYARKTFDFYKNDPNVTGPTTMFLYNSLIRGYSTSEFGDEAFLLYIQMVNESIIPDNYTFPFVLSGCTKLGDFRKGIQIHAVVFKLGLQDDIFIENSLIHFYCENGGISDGRQVFDEMVVRNVVSYTSMICGYARASFGKEAISLFFEMVDLGILPNSLTMVCVISACAKLRDVDLANRICGYIGESGVEVNMVMENALVDMYLKCGASDVAMRHFNQCVDKNLVLCNTMLSNYVRMGMFNEALKVLDEMFRQGTCPDKVTILSTISIAAYLGDALFAKWCHCYVLRTGLDGFDNVSNALIDMYMKNGKPEMGTKVFDRMQNKTVVSWNSLVAGLVQNGDTKSALSVFNGMAEKSLVTWNTIIAGLVQESKFDEAIQLFHAMQKEGIKADKMTMVSVCCACGYLGSLGLAKWAYTYIKKKEVTCDMKLETSLVDMFARCGDTYTAMQVFNAMKERDVYAWSVAIGSMAMVGNGKIAIELFNQMVDEGVKPDGVVFTGVLTACSHGGLVEQGMDLFSLMKERYGINPQVVHYGCIVDMLGRAGLLKEAIEFIKNMPIEPNDVIWGSILAACRTYKNVELASYAAEKLTKLPYNRPGMHVLLSNIYAAAEKWTDVAKVRLDMNTKGLTKVPGSSSIEINGVLHQFTSSDESHSQIRQIAQILHEMKSRLTGAGYVADLTNVLLDMEDEERSYVLSRHSEKLAIAFGLISTGCGEPIHIVKNLRMCSDCHKFVKMVSKIYGRTIVIRDNNRFHFFEHGLCSCSDYW